MLKNIIKLEGVQTLSKSQQESIDGGRRPRCFSDADCFRLTGDPTVVCYHGSCLVQ